MKKTLAALLLFALAVSGIGCALNPLNGWERMQIQEIRDLQLPEQETVSPALTRALSVIPGGGRVYLALAAKGEVYQLIPGALELWLTAGSVNWATQENTAAPFLLLAPLWIFDFIGAGEDAENVNVRATIKHYLNGPGREEYERRKRTNPQYPNPRRS